MTFACMATFRTTPGNRDRVVEILTSPIQMAEIGGLGFAVVESPLRSDVD